MSWVKPWREAMKIDNENKMTWDQICKCKARFWKWKSVLESKVLEMKSILEGEKSKNQELEEQNRKNSINYADSLQAQLGSQRQKYEMETASFKMM